MGWCPLDKGGGCEALPADWLVVGKVGLCRRDERTLWDPCEMEGLGAGVGIAEE